MCQHRPQEVTGAWPSAGNARGRVRVACAACDGKLLRTAGRREGRLLRVTLQLWKTLACRACAAARVRRVRPRVPRGSHFARARGLYILTKPARLVSDAHAALTELVAEKLRLYREALIDVAEGGDAALQAVRAAAASRGAVATVLRQRASGGADVLVRFVDTEKPQVELRCAVVGNVDAGKSTLVSVLTTGRLDDGRGCARARVFRHAHEIESGRTSSVSQVSLFFGPEGACLVDDGSHRGSACDVSSASKCINLVDLAGA